MYKFVFCVSFENITKVYITKLMNDAINENNNDEVGQSSIIDNDIPIPALADFQYESSDIPTFAFIYVMFFCSCVLMFLFFSFLFFFDI